MPATRTIRVYSFDELDDKVKMKLLDQCHAFEQELTLSENLLDMFKYELELLGYPTDDIEFSLSSCQGDGMAFYGDVDVSDYVGTDKPCPFNWAKTFNKILLLKPGGVYIVISRNSFGSHYSHWNTMDVEVRVDGCGLLGRGREWSDRDKIIDRKEGELCEELRKEIKEDIQAISHRLEKRGYEIVEHRDDDELRESVIMNNPHGFLIDGSDAPPPVEEEEKGA